MHQPSMGLSSQASSSTAPPPLVSVTIDSPRKEEDYIHRFGGLPKCVGLEEPLHRLQEALKEYAVLGVVGMDGIGKTTMAKQLFNHIAMEFEYACFVEDAKYIPIRALERQLLNQFHWKGTKVDANGINWSHTQEKKTLIVLDDVDQLTALPELRHFGVGSRLIVTTRDEGLLHIYEEAAFLFQVNFLSFDEAKKLFCQHAFGPENIPNPRNHHLGELVEMVVKGCEGLPLTLEVMGCYLRGHDNDVPAWEDSIGKLLEGDRNDRLWRSLRMSIDALAEEEREMFLEAAAFFFDQPLEEALAAWSTICKSPSVCWSNLLSRSMVAEVCTTTWSSSCNREIRCMKVGVHKLLRDVAKQMLAGKKYYISQASNSTAPRAAPPTAPQQAPRAPPRAPPRPPPPAPPRAPPQAPPRAPRRAPRRPLVSVTIDAARKEEDYIHRFGGLPKCVGLEEPLHRLQEALKEYAVLGVVGMDGIGKTTMAKQLFNHIAMEFEYACFVEDAKYIPIRALERQLLNQFHWKGTKVDANGINWSHTQEKKTLIVLDDVDSEDQLTALPELRHLGVGSRLIVTTRDERLLQFYEDAFLFQVNSLSSDEAKKLFCQHAFGPENIPNPRNHHLGELVEMVVRGCEGLPLTLEVMGCYLRGHDNDVPAWEDTIDKLLEGDRNDRLWRSLRVSIDALAEEEREMFLEAAAFFFDQPLEEALAAWSTICKSPSVCWSNLLSRSMVAEVCTTTWSSSCNREIRCMKVGVHKLLRDVAKQMLAGNVESLSSNEITDKAVVNTKWLRAYSDREVLMDLTSDNLPRESEEFKYVDLYGFMLRLRDNFPSRLSLLKWKARYGSKLPPITLDKMEKLAILELEDWEVPNELLGSLGNLTNLHLLSLRRLEGLDRLPDNFGRLAKLRRLELVGLRLLNLPVSFGNLSALEHLTVADIGILELPTSFGALSSLITLSIQSCQKLSSLTSAFGHLSSLEELYIQNCPCLLSLPDNFGQLRALKMLIIERVDQLRSLPETFGNLFALTHLTLREYPKVERFPDNFGLLSTLESLVLGDSPHLYRLLDDCGQLHGLKSLTIEGEHEWLPDSLGHLSVLSSLTLDCKSLEKLPESFGRLHSLTHLTLYCESLKLLPDTLRDLSSLTHLTLYCKSLKQLPESFETLCSLTHLTLDCESLDQLPENFGQLCSLRHVTLRCLRLRALPESFGLLSSLEQLSLKGCPNLESFPETFSCLMALRRLTIPRFALLNRLSNSTMILVSLEELSIVNPVSDANAQAIVRAYFENEDLTAIVEIDWSDVSDLSLRGTFYLQRRRNVHLKALKKKIRKEGKPNERDEAWRYRLHRPPQAATACSAPSHVVENTSDPRDVTRLICARIFLCGYPEVGKTRLRTTLKKSISRLTKFKWETRPRLFKGPRTRGIEVNRVQERLNSEESTLLLWDLAGQPEFHVLHGLFFPDLGFAHGKATTFVLVFKATFEESVVQEKLLYWLRFVASSSQRAQKDGKRHVIIVLNCFGGKQCEDYDKSKWTFLIEKYEKMFQDLLSIRKDPFIIDVRVISSVKPLKDHLFKHVWDLLEDERVPRLCFDLQVKLKEKWPQGEKSIHYPILTWQAFEKALDFERKGIQFKDALKAAASYLHETTGDMVYFSKPGSAESAEKSLVIPDPTWFCKEIVGHLLLPEQMATGKEKRVKVDADGSISVDNFTACFERKLHGDIKRDDVIFMLEKLGLCFRKGEERVIIPALIESQDDYKTMGWEGKGCNAVMGRSLVVDDKERTALPATLFRKLQVDLAKDENFGGRKDGKSRVGKSFSIFKVGLHLILIQFDEDGSDPRDDRIDILVKDLKEGEDSTIASLGQVKRICEIMKRLEKLCVICCPGVTYDIMVIEPWRATENTPKMIDRELMPLKDIKKLVMQEVEYTGWELQLKLKIFLSDRELEGVVDTAERNFDNCKKGVITLGLLTEDSLPKLEEGVQSISIESETCDGGGVSNQRLLHEIQDVKRVLRQEGRLTRQHFDKRITDLFVMIREKHDDLVKQLQAQQAFSIDEQESSVPRFMFLSPKQQGFWIKLKDALGQTTLQLHLLCEAESVTGSLHEIDGQEGIEITHTKEWLAKILPWMRWSLKVAVMVAQTAGNVYLPGVFSLIPDLSSLLSDPQDLATAVDSAAPLLLEEDIRVTQGQDSHGNLGSAEQPRNLKKERLIAQAAVNDLISQLPGGHIEFAKKIGLRKVLLRARVQPQVGSPQQADSVVWICDNCYKDYGDRARDISPRR